MGEREILLCIPCLQEEGAHPSMWLDFYGKGSGFLIAFRVSSGESPG